MILAGIGLWLSGLLCGAVLTGYVFYLWMKQDARRLGTLVKWIVDALGKHNGGSYLKMYAALFETQRASKVIVYVKPEDLADAVGRYARGNLVFPLNTNPTWPETYRNCEDLTCGLCPGCAAIGRKVREDD